MSALSITIRVRCCEDAAATARDTHDITVGVTSLEIKIAQVKIMYSTMVASLYEYGFLPLLML